MIDRTGELQTRAGPSEESARELITATAPRARRSSSRRANSDQASLLDSEVSGSVSASYATAWSTAVTDSTQRYLDSLGSILDGPLHDLGMELAESRILHFQALRAVAAKAEEDALTSIEACAERATSSASRTCKALQELSPETQPGLTNSEKNLRRQSFSGIMVLFQNSLNAYFTAQQAFRAQMEAKVSRQLRAAFPDADDAAVAAVASAGHRSASTAIQQTLLFQPGTTQLNTSVALTAARLRTDEVERLADVAAGLKKAFLDFENLVVSQGEVIDDIGRHIQATLEQTKHAVDTLQVAESAHRKRSWRNCVLMIVIAVALCILISVAVSRFF